MGELGGELDLAEEAPRPEGDGDAGVEHLDRDLPVGMSLLRQEHSGHPAATDLPLDQVSVGQARLEPLEELSHDSPDVISLARGGGTTPG